MGFKKICVFCGSNFGRGEIYKQAAVELGEVLVKQDIALVYGGASVGLMGVLADTVLKKGGTVYGVIPRKLKEREIAHQGITELFVVEDMHQRKAKMFELSDGFVAMPGGFGTYEEFFEILTWGQIGIHNKPLGIFNVNQYFEFLFTMVNHGIQEKFIRPEYREFLLSSQVPEELLDKMKNFKSPVISKWIK